MKQITDKLFAVEVDADSHDFKIDKFPAHAWLEYKHTVKKCIIKTNTNLGGNYDLLMNCEILGTVSKDTIDFDVEPYVYANGSVGDKPFYPYYDGSLRSSTDPNNSFRSLLASKGLNPNAKHLIIEKI